MSYLDDTCAWCKHDLKVSDRIWEYIKSFHALPSVANYCNEKTCKTEGCEHKCAEVALSTPENEEKMLHEVVRRKRKLERLAEESRKLAEEATANAN